MIAIHQQRKRVPIHTEQPKPHISLYSPQRNIPMPLKRVSVSITIIENICQVEFVHEYINSSKYNLDCQYNFPVDSEWAVSSFTIQIDDKLIESKVFEAKSADQKFVTQVSQGNSAFKMGYSEDKTDMLSMSIGKFISGKTAVFTTKMVGKLDIERGMWILRIPFTCFPKYAVTSKPNTASEKYTQNSQYGFEMSCSIKSNNRILLIGKHEKFVIKNNSEQDISLTIPLTRKFLPNKDVKIAYSLSGKGEPKALIQKNEIGEYACLFNIIPSIKESDLEGKGEFIFVLDCSGSMRGKKMEYARSACRIFLQSLPTDSYFNIYKFGYNFKSMGIEKFKYTSENLKKALIYVNGFQADMGGTEILNPLQSIFTTTAAIDYPRNIFLLTDGEVDDTNLIFTTIKKNSMNCKVHAVGIGEGASRLLVKGVARTGNGTYQFVGDGDNISKVIVAMLEKVIKPAITNCEISVPKECGVQVISPSKTSFIYQDEAFNLLFISKLLPEGEITLSGMWTHDNSKAIYKCAIPKECITGSYFFPLAVKSLFSNDLEVEAELDLSIKYHVLSKYTKLLGVVRNTEISKLEDAKIFIPMILPAGTTIERPATYGLMKNPGIPYGNMRRRCNMGGGVERTLCAPQSNSQVMRCKKSSIKQSGVLGVDKEECAKMVMKESFNDEEIKDAVIMPPMDSLLELQDISGFWTMSDGLSKIAHVSQDTIDRIISLIKGIVDKELLMKIVATLIALKVLNTKFETEKDSWKLIENKAIKFLKRNAVEYETIKTLILI